MTDKKFHQESDSTLGLTSQEAVEAVGNRYDLVLIAAARCRELRRGAAPRVPTRSGAVLTTLKEIEQGKVDRSYLNKIAEPTKHHKKWN